MMKVVDLFCGCGGLSLGFQSAGMDVVAAFDNWPAATWVYSINFNHPVYNLDLTDEQNAAEKINQYTPDMIIGGPPCQDFSSAGLRNEDNGRGDLTVAYARIVSAINPTWFVMENVSTITKTNKLAQAIEIFKKVGYGLTQIVVNAALCGVPQRRKRFFMIGKMGQTDGFMCDYIKNRLAKKEMTVKDFFGDKIDIDYYYRHPRSYARRGIFSVNEPSPTIRGVNRPIPAGYPIHNNDPVKTTDGLRPLTTIERAQIQTFPPSFEFMGSKSDVEQMIGNAVPVKLGNFIAKSILDYSKDFPDLI